MEVENSDKLGCGLLIGMATITLGFGLMALGSFMPDIARIGFTGSALALVASAVLSGLLVSLVDYRKRKRKKGDEIQELSGPSLDAVGDALGVKRQPLESDGFYRDRVRARAEKRS